MITFPNAKINLGLNIVSKRSDGYHDIETVFYPTQFRDILEIVPYNEFKLEVSGRCIDCPMEKNLVYKAYAMLNEQFELPPVAIYLHKVIPDGAGLGGGSADAAFTLKMLTEMFSLPISIDELARMAVRIGADCPFFIYKHPMMATGIGDKLSSLEFRFNEQWILIVKPDVYVSTKSAYSQVAPRPSTTPIPEILSLPISEWKGLLNNDFEPSVFAQFPELAEIKQRLYESGAVYASMSGSGSSVFGIYGCANMADGALTQFRDNGYLFKLI